MQVYLTVLGSNSAVPQHNRHPSAQVLSVKNRKYLIDCGEGCQMQMNRYGIKRAALDQIFISHLHGDHFFGLIGLLNSMQLNRRKQKLQIIGPNPLKEIINLQFEVAGKFERCFEIEYIDTQANEPQLIFEDELVEVTSFPLIHRIPTTGFLFKTKIGKRKIIPEKIQEFTIPHEAIRAVKDGADFKTAEGRIVKNSELTLDPLPSVKYAYCSDTAYNEKMIDVIEGANLLYHESTFNAAAKERAIETCHSTTEDAAKIAKLAKAKKLLLGHFSVRYKDLEPLLLEAKKTFVNTALAVEGETFYID